MPAILPNRPPRRSFPGEIGRRIRESRASRGLQQRELASRANLDQPTLSKYESGVHPPPVRRLWGIARALALPVDVLLPPFDMPYPEDRELYAFFRTIWFQPLAIRGAVALALRGMVNPLARGGCDASR